MPINVTLPLFMAAQNSIMSELFGYLIFAFRIVSNFLLYCNLRKLSCNKHPVLRHLYTSSVLAFKRISSSSEPVPPASEQLGSTYRARSGCRERVSSSRGVLITSPFLCLLRSKHTVDNASTPRTRPAACPCKAPVGGGPSGVQLWVATWISVWGRTPKPCVIQGSTGFYIRFEASGT